MDPMGHMFYCNVFFFSLFVYPKLVRRFVQQYGQKHVAFLLMLLDQG